MIEGVSISALDVLQRSPYAFYLGGSRRMAQRWVETYGDIASSMEDKAQRLRDLIDGKENDLPSFLISVNEDTDYDLYATHTTEVEAFLIDNEFELSEANNYYLDTECVVIYKRDNVQVVLRYDAEFYKTVFENIDLGVYYHYLWKSSPTKPNRQLIGPFFNMLFDIAHAAKGEK